MIVVATVGTTHPLAFAGLTFAALALAADGIRPVCVVAGVTAQDASHVTARVAVDAASIAAQFGALHDVPIGAFHVGALLSAESVVAVAGALGAFPQTPVVLDPVFAVSGGEALGDAAARDALRTALIPRATLVTPNLAEASALLGRDVNDVASMREAASALVALGAGAALVKGGHLAGDPVDVFADAHGTREWRSSRIGAGMRGTGDLLAAMAAAHLARGASLVEAIECARHHVREAIARGVAFAGTRVASFPDD
ncbi:MAG TPA: PfkB family carbohydrate kinase [Candidatus Elarobacter sp.]|jgi:hydroxymethylpyrimidine/phosphomethylpyrimidine kinase